MSKYDDYGLLEPKHYLKGIICVLSNVAALCVPCYFLGTYWLNNPDAIQSDSSRGSSLYCWAPNKLLAPDAQNYAILAGNDSHRDPGYLNVTKGFLSWFECGFLLFAY